MNVRENGEIVLQTRSSAILARLLMGAVLGLGCLRCGEPISLWMNYCEERRAYGQSLETWGAPCGVLGSTHDLETCLHNMSDRRCALPPFETLHPFAVEFLLNEARRCIESLDTCDPNQDRQAQMLSVSGCFWRAVEANEMLLNLEAAACVETPTLPEWAAPWIEGA